MASRDAARFVGRTEELARLESLLEMSAGFQAVAHKTAHHVEAINAFVEKRKPDFSDR